AAVLMFQCGHSKIEGFRRIEMTEEEPFLGFVEADPIAEIRLAQFLPAGSIVQNSAALIDRLNRERLAVPGFDRIAHAKPHAAKRSVVAVVLARSPAGLKLGDYRSPREPQDGSEAQLRFAITDPALSGVKFVGHINRSI